MTQPSGVYLDLEREGDTLLVAFGGLAQNLAGEPVFEFFSLVEPEFPGVKRVFIRDLRQVWYLAGVEGVGANVSEVAEWLRRLAEGAEADRVIMVGASAGGFAAILFGALAGASEVHAFAPQTFLDRWGRARHLDRRRRRQIRWLRKLPDIDRQFLDLRPVVAAAGVDAPRCVIHYSAQHRLDTAHAVHMAKLPGVELRAYPFERHNVARELRESGRLSPLLASILAGPSELR
jgi:hypothetical protein